jgi:hypothetical protein
MRTVFPNRITSPTREVKKGESVYLRKNEITLATGTSRLEILINRWEEQSAFDIDARNRRIKNGTFQEFRGKK